MNSIRKMNAGLVYKQMEQRRTIISEMEEDQETQRENKQCH